MTASSEQDSRNIGEFQRLPQILRVTAQEFAAHGYRGASMRDIGAACGVSAPALYRYVGGKADLLSLIITDISQRLTEGAAERLESTDDPKTRLDILIEWHTEQAVQNPHVILVQDREWSHLAHDAEEAHSETPT